MVINIPFITSTSVCSYGEVEGYVSKSHVKISVTAVSAYVPKQ